jgi:hypothetical protein
MRACFVNEEFIQDSDPISDMDIGNPEKSLFPLLKEKLNHFNISIYSISKDESIASKGYWTMFLEDNDLDDEEAEDDEGIQVIYITDEAAKEAIANDPYENSCFEKGGGFYVWDNNSEDFIMKPSYDYNKVVSAILKRRCGNKNNVEKHIKKLEKDIQKLREIQKYL